MTRATLVKAIGAGPLVLDSSVILSYLHGSDTFSAAAALVLDEVVGPDAPAVLSAVTVTEILVRPFRASGSAVAVAELFLRHAADVTVRAIDYDVAREAARVRALTGLKTPDALIVATALVEGIETVVSIDDRWRNAIQRLGEARLVHLGAHLPV